jgi:2,3-bisphosphoglycerate-dependent phosphoglycerate mutase
MSSPRHAKASSTQMEIKYTLVLVRHGKSTLNGLNKSTSWVDCPVSEKSAGEEVIFGGKIWKEKSFSFDLWYAIKTLWIILEELGLTYIPIINIWRLNERHYGAHQKT